MVIGDSSRNACQTRHTSSSRGVFVSVHTTALLTISAALLKNLSPCTFQSQCRSIAAMAQSARRKAPAVAGAAVLRDGSFDSRHNRKMLFEVGGISALRHSSGRHWRGHPRCGHNLTPASPGPSAPPHLCGRCQAAGHDHYATGGACDSLS